MSTWRISKIKKLSTSRDTTRIINDVNWFHGSMDMITFSIVSRMKRMQKYATCKHLIKNLEIYQLEFYQFLLLNTIVWKKWTLTYHDKYFDAICADSKVIKSKFLRCNTPMISIVHDTEWIHLWKMILKCILNKYK